jgi:hypothetical protein
MPQKTKTTPPKTKTKVAQNGTAPKHAPSEGALQVVDRAVGAVPVVADVVRNAVGQWSKSETREQELKTLRDDFSNLRSGDTRTAQFETYKQRLNAELDRAGERGADVRRQVTDQVVERARKARERVEPVYRDRIEPVYKERVEPVYKQRVEPTVRRVRERI